jgi:hypothetical protein
MKTHTLSDIYVDYMASGGTLPKSVFKNLIQDFNIHMMNEIIYEGKLFDMGSRMSSIDIIRIKRNYKNPAINWNESFKLKKSILESGGKLYDPETGEGEKWFVYYTDPYYCRFRWMKSHCAIKNKSVYRFEPTDGDLGNKTKLIAHLREHPTNYLKYKNGPF